MGADEIARRWLCSWCGQEIVQTFDLALLWVNLDGLTCPVASEHNPVPAPTGWVIHAEVIESGTIQAAHIPIDQANEARQRARNQAIAEAHEREMRELANHQAVYGQWHQGTCVSCGMQDEVIGLPGSEYCRYCEELRVLKPPQPAVTTPAPPASRRRMHASVRFALLGWAALGWQIAGGPEFTGLLVVLFFGLSIAFGTRDW